MTAAVGGVASPGRRTLVVAFPDGGAAGAGLFDGASLTKPFTATLALQLHRQGRLGLDWAVGEVWPGCSSALARRPLADLLRHRSGFAAWAPLYRLCRGPAGVQRRLLGDSALLGARRPLYSDLGYIAWGIIAERVSGRSLAELLETEVCGPLGLARVTASPGARADVVTCTCDNSREVELAAAQGIHVARRPGPNRGEPQDGNARFLGSLAGHAGLFLDIGAALALGRAWLSSVEGRGPLPQDLTTAALAGRGEYALGWARRRIRGSAGPALSEGAFGHVGFTGTSLWIDPRTRTVAALLSHRTAPAVDLNPTRRRFHEIAVGGC